MSRRDTRAYKRAQKTTQARADFAACRDHPRAFEGYLRWLAASEIPVWPVAESVLREAPLANPEDAGAERALIASIVAPRIAAKTPGSVRRRHALGET